MTLVLEGYDRLMRCPVCLGGAAQANCSACAGRGEIDSVPYCERPWDEISPNLCLGGHEYQGGLYFPRDNWDVVVSMTHQPWEPRFQPDERTQEYVMSIRDEGCDVEGLAPSLNRLANTVVGHLDAGDRVLIRCWAGLNRAALVTGLVLLKQGWGAEHAITWMRHTRSPYVLFNRDFATNLRAVDAGMYT